MSDNRKSIRSWQEIAAAAAIEKDSEKLAQLVAELERAFELRDQKLRPQRMKRNGEPQVTP